MSLENLTGKGACRSCGRSGKVQASHLPVLLHGYLQGEHPEVGKKLDGSKTTRRPDTAQFSSSVSRHPLINHLESFKSTRKEV